ncbi:MAG: HAD-IC family P-type ATPase [Candidatus Magasanikbacteria bacterium]|nr:HAD-IC family P-type ATPase [Candidatus Magasanikbacteria bacterium]
MPSYHSQTIEQVFAELKTNLDGLSMAEVEKRLKEHGPNVLPKARERITRLKIFFNQWRSPLLLILLVAGVVSGILGEYVDTIVILLTAFLNAAIGFLQENKANRALEKLRQMVEYYAVVSREGKKLRIKSEEIAPGDILFLEAGDKVQADGRIIQAAEFLINEAALTGESEPVKKHTGELKDGAVVGDRFNMVYRGTTVASGKAKLVVTATGRDTEIGKIATLVKETGDEKTPLQIQLKKIGRVIGLIVLLVSAGVFALGVLSNVGHYGFWEMFETAVAVAVAAVPEGLVISLTMILTVGMQQILKRRALVRKLMAAETLGSVSVICTDKTGTLTEGKMLVTRVITARDDLNFAELNVLGINDETRHPDAFLSLRIAVLCNDGVLQNPEEEEKDWRLVGDSTDAGLVHTGMKVGLEKHHLDKAIRRIAEIPFNSHRKFMATLHRIDHESMIYVKGAGEKIFPFCGYYEEAGTAEKFSRQQLARFKDEEEKLTSQGLRVLAVAYKMERAPRSELRENDLNDLVFVGLVALSDPLRADVKEAIALTRQAGIRTVIITGDHRRTAQSIARELDLRCDDGQVVDGARLEELSDEQLQETVKGACVFARVDPKHKIRIVRALRANGEVVAMTGDGVNDAPALKGADIGVALGSGTDVAKEISDIVLLNDDFSTIVAAVEEGRGIYQNIKKVILYLLVGSMTEVVLIAGSIIAGLPLAILPVQILWTNLVQETFPALALPFDRGDGENMSDPPRRKAAFLIDGEMKAILLMMMLVSNAVLFIIFLYFYHTTRDIALARTIMFAGLGVHTLLYIYAVRSLRRQIWAINPFSNKYLTGAVLLSWALLICAVYFPPLQFLLRTVDLGLKHWGVLVASGLLNVVLIEAVKFRFLINKTCNI